MQVCRDIGARHTPDEIGEDRSLVATVQRPERVRAIGNHREQRVVGTVVESHIRYVGHRAKL
jgi:hypothetical protein